eukprot:scaffold1864_cov106-Isochrysis_galbana.AAC.6
MSQLMPNQDQFGNWPLDRSGTAAGLGEAFDVDDSVFDSLAEMVESASAAVHFGVGPGPPPRGDLSGNGSGMCGGMGGGLSYMDVHGHGRPPELGDYSFEMPHRALQHPQSYAPIMSADHKMSSPRPSLKGALNDGSYSWEGVQLVIVKHSVHKVVGTGADRDYVVSNLRPFTIDLQLVDISGNAPAECYNNLQLRSSLYYENGLPVRAPATETLLLGDTQAMVVRGHGQLKLKMGINALSSKLGKQRLRVKIDPVNEELRALPMLSVLTEPLRSVTKLERKPTGRADKDSAGTPGPFPASGASTPEAATATDPSPGAEFLADGEAGTLAPSLTRPAAEGSCRQSGVSVTTSSSWGEPPLAPEGRSLQEPSAPPPPGEAVPAFLGAAGAASSQSSLPALPLPAHEDVVSLKAMLLQERELFQQQVTALRNQLSDEHSDNSSIRKVLEMQQRQMQLMAKQNESILNEMASLRSSRAFDPGSSGA